jgi:hypothetical protein
MIELIYKMEPQGEFEKKHAERLEAVDFKKYFKTWAEVNEFVLQRKLERYRVKSCGDDKSMQANAFLWETARWDSNITTLCMGGIVIVTIMACLACVGDPDIVDAIIYYLSSGSLK